MRAYRFERDDLPGVVESFPGRDEAGSSGFRSDFTGGPRCGVACTRSGLIEMDTRESSPLPERDLVSGGEKTKSEAVTLCVRRVLFAAGGVDSASLDRGGENVKADRWLSAWLAAAADARMDKLCEVGGVLEAADARMDELCEIGRVLEVVDTGKDFSGSPMAPLSSEDILSASFSAENFGLVTPPSSDPEAGTGKNLTSPASRRKATGAATDETSFVPD